MNNLLISVACSFPQFYPERTVIMPPIVAECDDQVSLVAHIQPFLSSELCQMERSPLAWKCDLLCGH